MPNKERLDDDVIRDLADLDTVLDVDTKSLDASRDCVERIRTLYEEYCQKSTEELYDARERNVEFCPCYPPGLGMVRLLFLIIHPSVHPSALGRMAGP